MHQYVLLQTDGFEENEEDLKKKKKTKGIGWMTVGLYLLSHFLPTVTAMTERAKGIGYHSLPTVTAMVEPGLGEASVVVSA